MSERSVLTAIQGHVVRTNYSFCIRYKRAILLSLLMPSVKLTGRGPGSRIKKTSYSRAPIEPHVRGKSNIEGRT